jgi:hypothetical protein
MLSSVNRSVHLEVKLELGEVEINGLFSALIAQREAIIQQVFHQVLLWAQEDYLEQVRQAKAEFICTGCGVPHCGAQGWVQRGQRRRTLHSCGGTLDVPLLQTTCRDCGKTRASLAEALGLEVRSRYSAALKRKLVERVYETSYAKSAHLGQACWGVLISTSTLHRYVQAAATQVELTPKPECKVLLADGTKVPAGDRADQEELRMAFQHLGHTEEVGRSKAVLRLVGFAVGCATWPEVLHAGLSPSLVVTDAEPALAAHMRASYPEARHQLCEWHVVYTLGWSLIEAKVAAKQRRKLQGELGGILFSQRSVAKKRQLYEAFLEKLPASAQGQLNRALPHILFEEPSAVRTTSVVERQMREVNRRVDVGARWSVSGVRNLLLLSMTRKHNPDDYQRLWN